MSNSTRDRWLLINYAATIFTSAFLLFQIQPLISKAILPWFGGSPAVWTTCLLFFQSLLFAGYAYAHASHRRLAPRQQALLHGGLMLLAVAMLGVLPGEGWQPQGQYNPVARILLLLTVCVGLPYFVLSATGPLLQAWFARTFPAGTPYRLFALSNLGSMLALVSFPFVFEPAFTLTGQALLWSGGFIVYVVLCGYAAWRLWQLDPQPVRAAAVRGKKRVLPEVPARRQWLLWLAWPALASVALLATTSHVSTDIAVMPLLWVVPLALYLLTFIIAFDRPHWYKPALMASLALVAIYGAAMLHKTGIGWTNPIDEAGTAGWIYGMIFEPDTEEDEVGGLDITPTQFLVVNFAALFAICMMCHGELVRIRPAPEHLTSYYLMIAAGGALGGVFVTLIAPRLFVSYLEWELSLVVASLVAIGILLQAFVRYALQDEDQTGRRPWRYLTVPSVGLALFLPASLFVLDVTEFLQASDIGYLKRERNFFGALAVYERAEDAPFYHQYVLRHGSITHGCQFTHETRRRHPTTYFALDSGVGLTIDYFRQKAQPMRIGGVGLGVGTLAAYPDEGDSITFYEINPAVIEIAESGEWFTFLADCRQRGADCRVKLGDARLTLANELQGSPAGAGASAEPAQRYHVLALDAFSGDSIPAHLLTVEAFEIYLSRIVGEVQASGEGQGGANEPAQESGAIAVHISNRFVDLEPVVRAIAERFELRSAYIGNEDDDENAVYNSDWIILSRNDALMNELQQYAAPVPDRAPEAILWTDDYSSLLDVLK